MCKPDPGPRCAAHARSDLRTARSHAHAALRALRAAEAATNENDAWGAQRRGRVDAHTARAAAATAVRALEAAQRTYDSTPTGQRELAARLAAAENPPEGASSTNEDPDQLRRRLSTAEEHHASVMTRWRASSAHAEERLTELVAAHQDNPGDVADRIQELRTQIVQRRAAENAVPLPPTHPKARAAWERVEPRGRTWRALADLTSPASASLTYSDPQVHEATQAYLAAAATPEARDALLAACAKALPAPLAPRDDPTHHMYRAAADGRPWTVDAAELAELVAYRGSRRVDGPGAAATGGRPGDRWRVIRVVGHLRVTGGPTQVDASDGWICVRERDRLWRVLPEDVMGERLGASRGDRSG